MTKQRRARRIGASAEPEDGHERVEQRKAYAGRSSTQ